MHGSHPGLKHSTRPSLWDLRSVTESIEQRRGTAGRRRREEVPPRAACISHPCPLLPTPPLPRPLQTRAGRGMGLSGDSRPWHTCTPIYKRQPCCGPERGRLGSFQSVLSLSRAGPEGPGMKQAPRSAQMPAFHLCRKLRTPAHEPQPCQASLPPCRVKALELAPGSRAAQQAAPTRLIRQLDRKSVV